MTHIDPIDCEIINKSIVNIRAELDRLTAHRAALLAEVRAWRAAEKCGAIHGTITNPYPEQVVRMLALARAREATDALLGAEVTG